MSTQDNTAPRQASPLEAFLRDYLETAGGAWDEIEPQVYDVILPTASAGEEGVIRLTFDPEALPEHPGAQLASYGTPLVEQLLKDALHRGRSGQFYLIGLNLSPHNLAGRVRRALTLVEPLELVIDRVRALHFPQAVYWFAAEFISDQKEQEIVPVAIDLHYGRQVRHLDELLQRSRLTASPAMPLPEPGRISLSAGYALAREQALRTIATLANVRGRELGERLQKQEQRMSQYYSDLRNELEDQASRSRNPDEAEKRLAERRGAVDREEQLRITELRQKSSLRVKVRLLQLLQVHQPKLLVMARLTAEKMAPQPVELVWDPLMEAVEALPCPECQKPTLELARSRQGRAVCLVCAARPAAGKTRG